jgi:para-aminobenzoate synthetase/4-amino-4-deoxychorismate lyase
MVGMIEARFDDLRPGSERSFGLVDPVGVLEARRPREVADALSAAESAAARGLWVAGFVAYEAAPGLDPALVVRDGDPRGGLPLAWFAMFERREEVAPLEPPASEVPLDGSAWRASIDRETYERSVARIRGLIAAGETYQVTRTLRLRARVGGDDRGLYRDLALAQRGGFAAYLNLGRHRVLSASPELFFRLDAEDPITGAAGVDRITVRPMKGTAPRGRWLAEDEGAAARLVASPKERAENAMIVDLLRNDLGRIARPGSVRVTRMFEAERYETVWQLTSTVVGELEPATGLPEVFRALFPSGSVTGAPKVRTMRIIGELEDSPRGVYCGAIGYLAPTGSGEPRANFNVAIRTILLDRETGAAEYGVGGGITFDSSANAEHDEVLAKARVLTAARPAFELFEAIRHDEDGGFRHLAEHLDRLGASARYFGFRFDPEAATSALKRAADERGAGDLRIRLTLARDGTLATSVSTPPVAPAGPVRVAVDGEPVDPSDVWLFHKTTRRAPYERRRERRPDVDDVILVNTRGEVTESTIANVAARIDGRWVTPPLDAGLLPGTGRAVLVREGRLAERPIPADAFRSAEEIALVSSVRGWRAAELVP